MAWNKKRKSYNRRKNYSIVNKLEAEGKLDPRSQIVLNSLTLEELIAVKLELAAKSAGGKIYGMPIWFSILDIVRDACLKFSLSATRTNMEAARFLGLDKMELAAYLKKYGVKSYFDEENKTSDDA
jgi:hypothetical protein